MPRLGIVWILLFAAAGAAQEPSVVSEEPIPIPIEDNINQPSIARQSLVDDVFNNRRHPWGFSLAAYQGYSNDALTSGENVEGSGIAAFVPRTFFNLGKRRTTLHLDLGAGYRLYYRDSDLNGWDYFGNAQFSHQFSKKTSFQLSDQFSSSYNDSLSLASMSSPFQYSPGLSNEVLFIPQRINSNSLYANLSSSVTRKSSLGIFGSFNSYFYPDTNLGDSRAIEAGASYDYQLTRRLRLTNSYSSYFNYYMDEPFNDTRIDRLRVAGLEYQLTNAWRIWGRWGVDWAHYQEDIRTSESIDAGIGYTAEKTMFSFSYYRGFSSAIGLSTLMSSDDFNAYFGYRALRWMSLNAQSYYHRSHDLIGGLLETVSAGGGLQITLRQNLFLSANGFFQWQRMHNSSFQGLNLDRYSAYVGIQYVWPSLKHTP